MRSGKEFYCVKMFCSIIFGYKTLFIRKRFYIRNYETTFRIGNVGFDKKHNWKILYWRKFEILHIIQIFKKHQLCSNWTPTVQQNDSISFL